MTFDYNKLVDRCFVRGPDGHLAYYPWGTLLRGYRIDSENREVRLRVATRRYYRVLRVALPIMIIGALAINSLFSPNATWIFLAAMIVGLCLPWYATIRRLTKTLDLVPRAPRPTETRSFIGRLVEQFSYLRLSLFLAFFAVMSGFVILGSPRDKDGLPEYPEGLILMLLIVVSLLALLGIKLVKGVPTAETPEQQIINLAWRPVWIVMGCLFVLSLVLVFSVAMHGV